jgi:signal transduction histidine kinase
MKPLTRRGAFSLPLQVLLWAAGSSVAGAVVGLVVGLFREIDGRLLLMSLLFGNVVGLTVFVCSVALYPALRNIAPFGRYLVLTVGLLAGSMAGTALVGLVFRWFVLANPRQSLAVFALNAVLALIVGGIAHAYEGMRWRLAESLREVEEVRLVEAELHEQAARAELAALQARINPHFFFNTLNTISALLGEDPAKADEVVQTLADLFRYTFKAAHADAVTLAEELEFVEGYLAVEKARFGDRLKVAWAVSPEAGIARVPGLILQPLVENAVKHGVAPQASGGEVAIHARVDPWQPDARQLTVTIRDTGAGASADQLRRGREEGVGLRNVERRLQGQYGSAASLSIDSAPGRGTTVEVRLPVTSNSREAAADRVAV